jgi:hypothetical protein
MPLLCKTLRTGPDVPHHRRGHHGAQPAGPGYKEELYERALAAELREREIPCEAQ